MADKLIEMFEKKASGEIRVQVCEQCKRKFKVMHFPGKQMPTLCPTCKSVIPKIKAFKSFQRRQEGKPNKEGAENKTSEEILVEIAPDKSVVFLKNDQEKTFWVQRRDEYLKDDSIYEASDLSLLTRLLMLELEAKRVDYSLTTTSSAKDKYYLHQSLIKITEELRMLQKDLSLLRSQRIGEKEKDKADIKTVQGTVDEALEKYEKWSKLHPEMYTLKCPYCGQEIEVLNYLPELQGLASTPIPQV